jgi:hypothetical protein
MNSIPVGYDFKETRFDFVDSNGKLNEKYICLPYMITLPLSQPTVSIPPPNTEPVTYKKSVISSYSNFDDWLSFVPVDNVQPNIITVHHNVLYFNNYEYNYDITVNVIKKGDTNVQMRFMAQNPYSLLASNMNDIYGHETVYDAMNPIKLTVTGEYQFFYIHYPTTNFELSITITVSNQQSPTMICNNLQNLPQNVKPNKKQKSDTENQCQCDECKKVKKCTCYDINGNGYIIINGHNVPVYITKTLGNVTTRYLYPEFSYLRDLFYNVTLANSLPVPVPYPIALSNNINDNFNNTFYNTNMYDAFNTFDTLDTVNITDTSDTVIACEISANVGFCIVPLWCTYTIIVNGKLISLSSSPVNCPFNQINEERNGYHYRYRWDNSSPILYTLESTNLDFIIYLWHSGAWYEQKRYKMAEYKNNNNNSYEYSLVGDYFDNLTSYDWIAFGFGTGNNNYYGRINGFNITISKLPN